MARLLRDVGERDDGAALRQRELELEFGFAADDASVEGKYLGPESQVRRLDAKSKYIRGRSSITNKLCWMDWP